MLIEEAASTLPKRPSRPPLIRFADLPALLYAYPLYGLIRLLPTPAIWAAKTFGGPVYRLLHRAKERLAAQRIRQFLDVPLPEAQRLARRWIDHHTRRGCYRLSLLSRNPSVFRQERTLVGIEHLERALAEGRGVLLVSIHSFAVVPATRFLREKNHSVMSVRRLRVPEDLGRLAQHWLGPRILRIAQQILEGSEAVSADDPNCTMILAKRLRAGGLVHIGADAKRSLTSIVVPFLKGTRGVSKGALDLARLCRCPVIPLTAAFTDSGVRVELGAPLDLRYTGGAEECAGANLPVLVAELERQVAAYPDQWDRWTDL